MKHARFLRAVVSGTALFFAAAAGKAAPLAAYIASYGSDANSCTRAAPCFTVYRAAVSGITSGGEVRCLDSGPVAFFTGAGNNITMNFVLDCAGGMVVQPSGGGQAYLSAEHIIIRNTTMSGTGGASGIVVASGKVTVDHCLITEYSDVTAYSGILVQPSGGANCEAHGYEQRIHTQWI
jgi:hypothetical protein